MAGTGKMDINQLMDVKRLNLTRSIDPIVPLGPTDIEGFLKNERETALINASEHAQVPTPYLLDDFLFNGLVFFFYHRV